MSRSAQTVCLCAVLALFFGVWLGSELIYSSRICPTGVRTVADHLHRFGEPSSVHEVRHDGGTFYEFTGSPDSLLALPSSPPAYIYDAQGRLVAWCRDPGDQPEFEQAWRRTTAQPLDKEVARRLVATLSISAREIHASSTDRPPNVEPP